MLAYIAAITGSTNRCSVGSTLAHADDEDDDEDDEEEDDEDDEEEEDDDDNENEDEDEDDPSTDVNGEGALEVGTSAKAPSFPEAARRARDATVIMELPDPSSLPFHMMEMRWALRESRRRRRRAVVAAALSSGRTRGLRGPTASSSSSLSTAEFAFFSTGTTPVTVLSCLPSTRALMRSPGADRGGSTLSVCSPPLDGRVEDDETASRGVSSLAGDRRRLRLGSSPVPEPLDSLDEGPPARDPSISVWEPCDRPLVSSGPQRLGPRKRAPP